MGNAEDCCQATATPAAVASVQAQLPDDFPESIAEPVLAGLALNTAQLLGLRRHTTRQLWPRAWQIRTNLSAYDAFNVALAEQLNLPLLSADGRLARAPGLRCQVRVV